MIRGQEFSIALGQDHLTSRDWDLQRKGPIDQKRHNEKLREVIRNNPGDILTHADDIVTSDGKKLIRFPIKSLDLPTPRRGMGRKGAGTGEGQVGDVVIPGQDEDGMGKKAGDKPGGDYIESEITYDEFLKLMFEDLGLPNLEDRGSETIESEDITWNSRTKKAPMPNLDRRQTFREAIRRKKVQGIEGPVRIGMDDLRFRTWEVKPKEEEMAVLIGMRDVSGSMGDFEREATRLTYAYMLRHLRNKFPRGVETVFIAHHATAREVPEAEFFEYGESGGTVMSSAYQLALEIIEARYPWQNYNIYPFHFTDGYNWVSDDKRCAEIVTQMFDVHHANMFGYAEISNPEMAELSARYGSSYESETLRKTFEAMNHPRMAISTIAERSDINKTVRKFLSVDKEKVLR